MNSIDSIENHHHHLVCVLCNRTIEFKEPFINGIGANQAESEGYRLLDCQLTLYGTCSECEISMTKLRSHLNDVKTCLDDADIEPTSQ